MKGKMTSLHDLARRLMAFMVIFLFALITVGQVSADTTIMESNYDINLLVSNDAGAYFDVNGDDTYNFFGLNLQGRYQNANQGQNALHITVDPSTYSGRCGQVTTTTEQSGVFYVSDTGGRPYDDTIILMLAVNGTIPEDFLVHLNVSGYQWESHDVAPTISDVTYVPGAVDEYFTKDDFLYGPQIWKPAPGVNNYLPIFCGQDMSDTENTFSIMFIDLNSGPLGFTSLENSGCIKVEYSIENLETFAAFNVYAYTINSNQGQGIFWTNAVTPNKQMSGYEVISIPLAINQLKGSVIALDLHDGIEEALTEKLDQALLSLSAEDVEDPEKTAANVLGAFINQVKAQSGKKIDVDDAEALISAAEAIIGALEQ